MKVEEQLIEILKAGNVTYPKATFQNIYNALKFLAHKIDKIKENELKLIGAVKLLAEEIDKLKEPESNPIHAINIDDVFAVQDPGDSTAFAIENISKSRRWAIGSKDKKGNWGMSQGPFLAKEECLEMTGEEGYYILELHPNATEIIRYVWSTRDNDWVKYVG